jgi:hypothetical protein
MNAKVAQIACPNCRSTIVLPVNGNAVDAPLLCRTCGQAFSPHFYCPDANSPARHFFAATKLYIDNAGGVYTFCPEHTFTTYALAADSQPRPRRSPFYIPHPFPRLARLSSGFDDRGLALAISFAPLKSYLFWL